MSRLAGMRAVIIGGGIGGLCTARALTRLGIEVDVFERSSSQQRSQVGGGITLWSNATKALAELDLADPVLEAGTILDGVEFCTSHGRRIGEWNLVPLRQKLGSATAAITRADLYRSIFNALPSGLVKYNLECRAFEQDDTGVRADFGDGRIERGDFLVGSDGLRSKVRADFVGRQSPRYAGYSIWQGQVPKTDGPLGVMRFLWGRGARFIWGGLKSGSLWQALLNHREASAPPQQGNKAMLIERFRGWASPTVELLEATPEMAINRLDIYDRDPLTRWGSGRVTLLGDAAHPMTFNIGQGSAQAIEDAVVLARSIAAEGSIEKALRNYEQQRMKRTATLTRMSRFMGEMGRWRSPAACMVRNLILRVSLSGLGQRVQVRQILCGI